MPASGAVGSVEEAELTLPAAQLEPLWRPEYLERLARGYWRFLGRVSLGLIKVVYRPESRTVVAGIRWFALLRFHAPEYETEAGRGAVTWRIDRGLLVARSGRGQGHLRIEVTREDEELSAMTPTSTLRVRVEVRNFYPLIRGTGTFARAGAWAYSNTQLRLHQLITYGFLRSLARLELPPSEVGALRTELE